jgi:glycosyltransferase involved in cell wall biosynthesis
MKGVMLRGHIQEQSHPLISVCVPTYNYARFLPDCIESVKQQTFSDWELVITDDCSDDGTRELVRRYVLSEPRIHYIVNERRLGMNPNLRRAANSGRGRYLKILCADDWLAPRCLEVMFRLMERHPKVVLAASAEIHTDQIGRPLRQQFLFGKPLSIVSGATMLDRMARIQGFGGNSSFFIRRSAYKEVGGYDPAVLYAGDWELAGRLCRIGDYLHTDEPLFYGRTHPTSSSSNDPRKLLDVVDHFVVPERTFRPREFPDREWRRYLSANMRVTARSLMSTLIQYARGNRDYAFNLLRLVAKHGNVPLALFYLPIHVSSRLYNYVIGKPTYGDWLPAESRMGTPSHWGEPRPVNDSGDLRDDAGSIQTTASP